MRQHATVAPGEANHTNFFIHNAFEIRRQFSRCRQRLLAPVHVYARPSFGAPNRRRLQISYRCLDRLHDVFLERLQVLRVGITHADAYGKQARDRAGMCV